MVGIMQEFKHRMTSGDFETIAEVVFGQRLSNKEIGQLVFESKVLDKALDDPKLFQYLTSKSRIDKTSPALYFYVLVRTCLLHQKIKDRDIASYVSSVILDFADHKRAFRISKFDDDEYLYSTDILIDSKRFDGTRKFQLYKHLGNYNLWLTGLFPEWIERKRLRGGPQLSFYESMGRNGFKMAALHPLGKTDEKVMFTIADEFKGVRESLNELATIVPIVR